MRNATTGAPLPGKLLRRRRGGKVRILPSTGIDDLFPRAPVIAAIGRAPTQPVDRPAIAFGLEAPLNPTYLPNTPFQQRCRETGGIAPKKRGTHKPLKFHGEGLERLKRLVEHDADATLQELLDRSGVEGSIMAVHRALERLGRRRRKVAPRHRARPPGCKGPTRGPGSEDRGGRSAAVWIPR